MSPPQSSSPDAAEHLFAACLRMPLAEQDAHFVSLCEQHPQLAAQLHRMRAEWRAQQAAGVIPAPALPSPPRTLHMHPGAKGSATARPVRSHGDPTAAAELLLSTVNQSHRYTLLGELGRGSMGVALRVFDTVLRRPLAMKVLAKEPNPAGDAHQKSLAVRFLDEARVTGSLEHPHIVPVYDLHADPTGRVFFTMPIIEGIDLSEVILRVAKGDPEWTMLRAVGVIHKVCEAVAFAHSRGVLHRDLSPTNVRVGKFGEVHVIDWGLAKVLGTSDRPAVDGPEVPADPLGNADSAKTMHGTVLGTPAYMSPEQADGRIADITARSDVYATGALLYHLLAGEPPFTSRRRTLAPERIIRLLRRGSPPAIERLNRRAPPELVAIADKAMARRPEDRFADMNAMAADLLAYIEGRVVPTYERGLLAELRKLILRNRTVTFIVGVAVFAIVYNLIEFAVKHFTEKARLEAHNAELRRARDDALEAAERAETMRVVAQQHEQKARGSAYAASIVSVDMSLRAGDVRAAKLRLLACAEDLRRWEWSHLQLRADGSLQAIRLEAMPTALATAAARRVVVGCEDGRIEVWSLDDSTCTHRIDTGDKPIQTVTANADGTVLVAFRGGGVAAWNPATSELSALHTLSTLDIASSRDPLACATDGSVVSWRDSVRTTLAPALSRPPRLAVLSRSGEHVATVQDDDRVLVRSTTDGATLAEVAAGEVVTAIALGSSRHLLALGMAGGAIRIHSTSNGELIDVLRSQPGAVRTLAFDASERRLCASGDDFMLRVWNLLEGSMSELLGHEHSLAGAEFADDIDLIVSASHDGVVRIWSAAGSTALTTYPGFGSPLSSGVFAANGRQAYFGTSDGFVVGRDTVQNQTTHLWQLDEGVTNLALGAGGQIFTLLADGRLMRLSVENFDAPPAPLTAEDSGAAMLCASDTGLVCGRSTGQIELRSDDGAVTSTWQAHAAPLIAIDAQGPLLATIAEDRRLRVWRLPSAERSADLDLACVPRSLALRRDGLAAAVGTDDGGVLVFDLVSDTTVELRGHQSAVVAIAWCGNTHRLATGSDDGTLSLWDLETGERLLTERRHGGAVHTVSFDSSCTRLLSISSQFGSLILESEPGQPRDAARREGRRAEQDWAEVLRTLFDHWSTEEQVMADLRSRADVPAAELRLGIILARTQVLRAARLRAEVWQVVRLPGAAASRYESALAKAHAATALVAGDPENAAMEGAALYRCGRPEEALAVLQRIQTENPAVLLPAVTFQALAAAALGDATTARRRLERLREAIATLPAGSVRHAEFAALLAEVEGVAKD